MRDLAESWIVSRQVGGVAVHAVCGRPGRSQGDS